MNGQLCIRHNANFWRQKMLFRIGTQLTKHDTQVLIKVICEHRCRTNNSLRGGFRREIVEAEP